MSGLAADDFLGTQGDPRDTQTDMLWALIDATISVLALNRLHDKSMAKVAPEITAGPA
ncbi:MAG TPA: hypothetical protein VK717_09580 [Opitutaceae bacterium]|jgi:putative membrane protein|nr:hypothetical protein [Opitutaceae bacterium]